MEDVGGARGHHVDSVSEVEGEDPPYIETAKATTVPT
jgi:hypothetical protein